MGNLRTEITLSTKGKDYTITVPDVRQFLAIENLKVVLSNNRYDGLLVAKTMSASVTLDIIDMVAVYRVLVPNITKHLKVDDILDLSVADIVQLRNDFNAQVSPWINEWMKLFQMKDEKSESNGEGDKS